MSHPLDGEKVTPTKLEVANRQLETAALLWFTGGDAVSTHTLVAAAHRVVHDLAVDRGSGAVLLDGARLAEWGWNPKAYKKAIRQAETFFKHAETDAHETYTFSAFQTMFIWQC